MAGYNSGSSSEGCDMQEDLRREDPYTWESSVRLSCVGRDVEDFGMYLEERDGRKRKWQEVGGKMMRREEGEEREREQRKMPPKKIMAAAGEMGGSGGSSASSHMSPGWPVNELDLELPGELSMNEALLSLAVFKQEAPSPTSGAVLSPPRRSWARRDDRQITNMAVDGGRGEVMEESCQQSPNHNNNMISQHGSPENMQCQPVPAPTMMHLNGYHSPDNVQENKNAAGLLMCSPASSLEGFLNSPIPQRQDASFKDDTSVASQVTLEGARVRRVDDAAGLLMCSPASSLEGFLNSPIPQRQDASFKDDTSVASQVTLEGARVRRVDDAAGLLMCSPASSLEGFLNSPIPQRQDASFKDDTRFQYVLAAATSIATKTTEETLTYLNQGQPYEIKLKKLGDLSHYKGKILKSVIKICFHERRLQYMEREQIAQWHAERPGERIVEVDVPLSYGVIKLQHPTSLNALHVYWDPFKDVGVYIKVNCISTEFTAKKHGGEKGVPFRIQVETYLASDDNSRLHAAACQIKVFKLKGADRKHKQDREKVMRRPRQDLEKYQPGCEATVLTTLSNDAMMPPPSLLTSSPPYSPELCVTPKDVGSPVMITKPVLPPSGAPAILASANQMKPLYCQDEMKMSAPPCHSPGAILPDLPQAAASNDVDKSNGLSKDASAAETSAWLDVHRFQQHALTFANFSGADLLRLSRDDIIQICGLADGIRLYNALHAKRIEPRLTIYVCSGAGNIYSALYLHACRARELLHKLNALLQTSGNKDSETVLVSGPNGARVRLTDELVRHLPDNSTYRVNRGEDCLLLCPTNH